MNLITIETDIARLELASTIIAEQPVSDATEQALRIARTQIDIVKANLVSLRSAA